MNDGIGVSATREASGERFHCTRCNSMRPLRPGEDGFQLYTQHVGFCNPAGGNQLWLPLVLASDEPNPSVQARGL
jgi:hypothetical protein